MSCLHTPSGCVSRDVVPWKWCVRPSHHGQ